MKLLPEKLLPDRLTTYFMKMAYKAMEDKSGFIKFSGIAGIFTTAVCQTAAVLINKDVPEKEKKFMVAQEVADGAINLAVFWTLTNFCVNKGRNKAKYLYDLKDSLDKRIHEKEFKDALNTLKQDKSFEHFDDERLRDGYVNGLGSIIGMIGSVTANNFISPPLRNYFASLYQKQHLKEISNQPKSSLDKPSTFTTTQTQSSTFKQQKPAGQDNKMSVFLNHSKYQATNPVRPF